MPPLHYHHHLPLRLPFPSLMAYYRERRQLDLDAPLMSTRQRPTSNMNTDHNTSMRVPLKVPFSWERAPGIPKDQVYHDDDDDDDDDDQVIMPPRPPPGWRRSPDNNDISNSDDNHYCSDSEVFSDALDELSLSDSLGVGCRMSVDARLDHHMSSFIMNRFLPAANALAADSAPADVTKYSKPRADHQLLQRGTSSTRRRRPEHPTIPPPIRTTRKPSVDPADLHQLRHQHSGLPSRVCGLMPVLPWNLKSTICGFKSPVRSQTTTPRASVDAPQLTVRTKRCTNDHGYDHDKITGIKGIQFLDTSRLMRDRERKSCDAGKLRDLIRASRVPERVSERSSRVHTDQKRRPSWSLPQINSPSESWISHTVNSGNRR